MLQGDLVYRTGQIVNVPIGPGTLGRVTDALGQPIDVSRQHSTARERPSRVPGRPSPSHPFSLLCPRASRSRVLAERPAASDAPNHLIARSENTMKSKHGITKVCVLLVVCLGGLSFAVCCSVCVTALRCAVQGACSVSPHVCVCVRVRGRVRVRVRACVCAAFQPAAARRWAKAWWTSSMRRRTTRPSCPPWGTRA